MDSRQAAARDAARAARDSGAPLDHVVDAFVEAWLVEPSRIDVLYELARLLSEKSHYQGAYKVICRAAAVPVHDAERHGVPVDVYRWRITDLRSMMAYRLGFHDESVDLCDQLLASPHLPHEQRDRILSNRRFSLEHVREQRHPHRPQLVEQITRHLNNPQHEPRITLTITTCKRRELFERTIDSFLHCCLDRLDIDRWICIDDGSTPEDLQAMRNRYPFIEYITKPPSQRGHAHSMNRLLQEVTTPYWLHLEDDWDFITIGHFLQQATHVLDSNPTLIQTVLNRNWMVTAEPNVVGGVLRRTESGFPYREHVYLPRGSAAFRKLLDDHPGGRTAAYWPGFSLNPSVIRTDAVRSVGAFNPGAANFEKDFSERARRLGWNTAFLDTITDLTSGPTHRDPVDKRPANAYALNGVTQFASFDDSPMRVGLAGESAETLTGRLTRQFPHSGSWRGVRVLSVDAEEATAETRLHLGDPDEAHLIASERSLIVDPSVMSTLLLWNLDATYDELVVDRIRKERSLSVVQGRCSAAEQGAALAIRAALALSGADVDPYVTRDSDEPGVVLPEHDHRDGLFPYEYAVVLGTTGPLTSLVLDALVSECLVFTPFPDRFTALIGDGAVISVPSDDPEKASEVIRTSIVTDERSRRLPAIRDAKWRILNELQFAPSLAQLLEAGRQAQVGVSSQIDSQ